MHDEQLSMQYHIAERAISHFLGTGQPIKFRMYFFGLQNNLQSAVHRFTIALFYSINFFLKIF